MLQSPSPQWCGAWNFGPLPDGAVLRMGSTRLRHAGLSVYAFLDGGKRVVTAGTDSVLRFWDTASGRQLREVRLEGNPRNARAGPMSPDGKCVVIFSDGRFAVWQVETGLPSGMGFGNGANYVLPTSKGDVCTIDLTTGAIVSRSTALRAPGQDPAKNEKIVLGNLIPYRDTIISQTVTEVTCHPQLPAMRK